MIAIVDYGMGNVRSLSNAFEYLGEDVVVTHDPALMDEAERIVLPGVGAFGDAMVAMRERGVIAPLNRQPCISISSRDYAGIEPHYRGFERDAGAGPVLN